MPRTYVVLAGPSHGVAMGPRTVDCQASTVGEALGQACAQIGIGLVRQGGEALRPGVAVFVNGADIRFAQGLQTALAEGDLIAVVCPATDT